MESNVLPIENSPLNSKSFSIDKEVDSIVELLKVPPLAFLGSEAIRYADHSMPRTIQARVEDLTKKHQLSTEQSSRLLRVLRAYQTMYSTLPSFEGPADTLSIHMDGEVIGINELFFRLAHPSLASLAGCAKNGVIDLGSLGEVSPRALKTLKHFVYTGELPPASRDLITDRQNRTSDIERLIETAELAQRLGFTGLLQQCDKVLGTLIDEHNIFSVDLKTLINHTDDPLSLFINPIPPRLTSSSIDGVKLQHLLRAFSLPMPATHQTLARSFDELLSQTKFFPDQHTLVAKGVQEQRMAAKVQAKNSHNRAKFSSWLEAFYSSKDSMQPHLTPIEALDFLTYLLSNKPKQYEAVAQHCYKILRQSAIDGVLSPEACKEFLSIAIRTPCLQSHYVQDERNFVFDDGVEFKVNILSLICHSPYFRGLLQGDFKEKNLANILLKEIPSSPFLNLYSLLHSPESQVIHAGLYDLLEQMHLSKRLCLEGLLAPLELALFRMLNSTTAEAIAMAAVELGRSMLLLGAMKLLESEKTPLLLKPGQAGKFLLTQTRPIPLSSEMQELSQCAKEKISHVSILGTDAPPSFAIRSIRFARRIAGKAVEISNLVEMTLEGATDLAVDVFSLDSLAVRTMTLSAFVVASLSAFSLQSVLKQTFDLLSHLTARAMKVDDSWTGTSVINLVLLLAQVSLAGFVGRKLSRLIFPYFNRILNRVYNRILQLAPVQIIRQTWRNYRDRSQPILNRYFAQPLKNCLPKLTLMAAKVAEAGVSLVRTLYANSHASEGVVDALPHSMDSLSLKDYELIPSSLRELLRKGSSAQMDTEIRSLTLGPCPLMTSEGWKELTTPSLERIVIDLLACKTVLSCDLPPIDKLASQLKNLQSLELKIGFGAVNHVTLQSLKSFLKGFPQNLHLTLIFQHANSYRFKVAQNLLANEFVFGDLFAHLPPSNTVNIQPFVLTQQSLSIPIRQVKFSSSKLPGGEVTAELLEGALKRAPHLTELCIERFGQANEEDAKAALEVLIQHSHLTKLTLTEWQDDLSEIVPRFAGLHCLEELVLLNCNVSNEAVKELLAARPGLIISVTRQAPLPWKTTHELIRRVETMKPDSLKGFNSFVESLVESQFSNQSLGALFGAGGMLEKTPGLILQLATAYLIQGAQHMRIPLIAEVLGDVKSTRIRTSLLSALDLFRFIGSAVAINERDPRIPHSLFSLLTASIARKHLPACRKWVSDTLIPKLKEAEEAHVLPQADDAVKHMCVTLMRRHLLSEERKHEFTALLRNVISAPSQWSEEHLMPVLPDLEKFKEEWKELAYQLGAEVRVTLALHGLAKILPEVLEVLEKALDEPYASLVT